MASFSFICSVLFFFLFFFSSTFLYLGDFMKCEMLTGIFNLIVDFFSELWRNFPRSFEINVWLGFPTSFKPFAVNKRNSYIINLSLIFLSKRLPWGICMMPTVTPPVISADKSFFTLYFGNQRIIGARQTRRERKPFHEHEQEAILW